MIRPLAFVAALLSALLLGPSASASVGPTPSPYPSAGGAPMRWTCERQPGSVTDPQRDTCAVTQWGTNPVETPAPAPTYTVSPATGNVHVDDEQFSVVGGGLILTLLLLAAVLASQLRRP